jgi:hypothetical protein
MNLGRELSRALSRRGSWTGLLMTLLALMLPASALAQATRTWVSGVGDDANPCSRTAPCKTWAGAISKTAPGGEIDALDPGGFGALTITKSITIDGGGGQVASVLVAGTNGITVNAASNDRVIIRNLRIDGLAGNGGNLPNAGINGIQFLSGKTLRLENVRIFGFAQNGVLDNASGTSILSVSDSTIADNYGDGVLVAPGSGGIAGALLEGTQLEDNNCGLVATTMGTGTSTCGTGTSAVGHIVTATAFNGSMSINSLDGVLTSGTGAKSYLSHDLITENPTGIEAPSSGQNISVCGDILIGNISNGTFTSSTSTGCT